MIENAFLRQVIHESFEKISGDEERQQQNSFSCQRRIFCLPTAL